MWWLPGAWLGPSAWHGPSADTTSDGTSVWGLSACLWWLGPSRHNKLWDGCRSRRGGRGLDGHCSRFVRDLGGKVQGRPNLNCLWQLRGNCNDARTDPLETLWVHPSAIRLRARQLLRQFPHRVRNDIRRSLDR